MASFPSSIASFSAAVDYETVVDASIDNGQWAEIVAIETVLGINPATIGATAHVEGTVGYNIDTLVSDISTLTSSISGLSPSGSTPQPVGATGASGGATSTSASNHVHAGVAGLTGTGITVSAATGTVTIGPFVPRSIHITPSFSTYTPDCATQDVFDVGTRGSSGPTGSFTIANPTGAASDGQSMLIRIWTASAQTIGWGTAYHNSGIFLLPTTSLASATMTLGFKFDVDSSVWILLAADTVGY